MPQRYEIVKKVVCKTTYRRNVVARRATATATPVGRRLYRYSNSNRTSDSGEDVARRSSPAQPSDPYFYTKVLSELQGMKDMQSQLMTEIKELKGELHAIKRANSSLKSMCAISPDVVVHNEPVKEESIDIDRAERSANFNFPLATVEELFDFDTILGFDPLFKQDIMSRLCRFGGKNDKATLRTVSSFLFDDAMLSKFSWGGTATKLNFSAYRNIADCVLCSMLNDYPTYTECDVRNFYKEYIKHSSERAKRKNGKAKKSDQAADFQIALMNENSVTSNEEDRNRSSV